MNGQEERSTIDSRVEEQEQTPLPFSKMVDEISMLLRSCKDFGEDSAFELIASEKDGSIQEIREQYKAATEQGTTPPQETYAAAQTIYNMLKHEIERRAIKTERQKECEKAAKASAPKTPRRKKHIPEYHVDNGHVGGFAFRALVDMLVEDKKFSSPTAVTEAMQRVNNCRGEVALRAYETGHDCTAEAYEGLARLAIQHCCPGEKPHEIRLRFVKHPKQYNASDQQILGQLLYLPGKEGGVGAVIRKLDGDKVEVARIDGEKRILLENQPKLDRYAGLGDLHNA